MDKIKVLGGAAVAGRCDVEERSRTWQESYTPSTYTPMASCNSANHSRRAGLKGISSKVRRNDLNTGT